MKKLIIGLMFVLVACHPHRDDRGGTTDLDNKIKQLQASLDTYIANYSLLQQQADNLDATVATLNTTLQSLITNYNALLVTLSGDEATIASLGAQLDVLNAEVDSLNAENVTITNQQTTMETAVNNAIVQIAILQGYTHIVEALDVCGDSPGHIDEVLLRLSDGTLLASFSDNVNGLNTRFSIIPPGNYQTSDGTSCFFTVHNDGTVTW